MCARARPRQRINGIASFWRVLTFHGGRTGTMQMTASAIVLVAVQLLFFVPRLPLQIFNQRIERKRAGEREQRRKKNFIPEHERCRFRSSGLATRVCVFVLRAETKVSSCHPMSFMHVFHSVFQQWIDESGGKEARSHGMDK